MANDLTLQALIEALPGAVWLVGPHDLCIVAANAEAMRFFGASADAAPGRMIADLFPSPEDACFWADVAAGLDDAIESETLILRGDVAVPVLRRVRRCEGVGGATGWLVVSLRDRSAEVQRAREQEQVLADLRATLESTPHGILVTDLAGRINHFNQRFAAIWDLPAALGARRDDDAVLDWMRASVTDPAAYMRRLAAFDEVEFAESTDRFLLRSGKVIERVTGPQLAHGRAVGRVMTFRDITSAAGSGRGEQAGSVRD